MLTSSCISLYFVTDLKTKQNSNFSTSLSESVWSAQLIIIFQHSSGQMRCCVLFQFSDPARSRREPQHRQTSHSEPEPDVPSHATVTSFTRRYEAGETVWLFFPSFVCWVIPPWGINDRCFYAKRGRHWRERGGVLLCRPGMLYKTASAGNKNAPPPFNLLRQRCHTFIRWSSWTFYF